MERPTSQVSRFARPRVRRDNAQLTESWDWTRASTRGGCATAFVLITCTETRPASSALRRDPLGATSVSRWRGPASMERDLGIVPCAAPVADVGGTRTPRPRDQLYLLRLIDGPVA